MALAGFSSINFAASLRNLNSAPGTSTRTALAIPRLKFTYLIEMQINPTALSNLSTQTNVSNYIYNGQIYGQLKSIDYPKVRFETQTLRAYNRYRKVYTKMMYDPCNITWTDDSTSMVSGLVKEYINFYHETGNIGTPGGTTGIAYDDTQMSNEQGIVGNNVRANMATRQSLGLKLRPQYQRTFFEYITIYDLGTEPTSIGTHTFHKPQITSFDHEALDYYSNDIMNTSWSFEYENYSATIGQNVDDFSDVLDLILGGDSNS